jgi:hypothetical protein
MMTRWIAASAGVLALTLALAVAPPFVNDAAADGVAPRAPRAVVFKHKRCIAPAMWWGRGQTTWVCNSDEICCYDRLLRKGSCLPTSQRCF